MISCTMWVHWYAIGADVEEGEGNGELTLLFDPRKPLEVVLDCRDENRWLIGRDLYCTGVFEPCGLADVRFEPYKTVVAVTFLSHAGRGLVLLPRLPAVEFAQQIRDIDDTPDIDGLLTQIFGEQR